jgi:hypothetical protein
MNLIEEAVLREHIDDQLIDAYWESVEHYKTRDLVMYLDPHASIRLRAFVRTKLVQEGALILPPSLLQKLSVACEQEAATEFWFLLALPEQLGISVVRAHRIGSQAGEA